MRDAFKQEVYRQLNKLEFNFLIALAKEESFDKATKSVGLSRATAVAMYNSIFRLGLLNTKGNNNFEYEFLPEFKSALLEFSKMKIVKSIFPSPQADKLYQKLKLKYLYVYPEQPVSVFIKTEDIKHLFTEKWHEDYFMKMRIDCVVCDDEGYPKACYEYQGGYHESDVQKQMDDFKKKVVQEVGIIVNRITSKELNDL